MTLFIIIGILVLIAACCLIPTVRQKIASIFVKEKNVLTEEIAAVTAKIEGIGDDIKTVDLGVITAKAITEQGKYILRFGIVLLLILPISWLLMGPQAVKTVLYKVCLVSAAIGLAELLWLSFFKPTFGKTEDLNENDKRTVLIFRGILYAAIVLAFTLGL